MEAYLVPTADAKAEFVEKRSRFIGRIFCCETEEEALYYLKEMRQKHWDATHNVYAYIIHGGPTRYSDDGEPQGTAGMPVLEVLRGAGLENVLCVVTRYFGGTLLGVVRAYGKSAKDAIQAAGISVKQLWSRVDLILPYNLYERLSKESARYDAQILDTEYAADILLHLILPKQNEQAFLDRVVDVTAGRVRGVVVGEEYRAFPKKT